MALYIQFGCGFSAPEGWRNFDASPTLRFERLPIVGRLYVRNKERFPQRVEYGDVLRGLPVPSNSCAGVYASHVLEHLSLVDFGEALTEVYRILTPGGIFRLVVPDLYTLCRDYISSYDRGLPDASNDFLRNSYLGVVQRPRGLSALIRASLGNSDHLWMWDELSLHEALGAKGFVNIRRAQCGDCEDGAFGAVENPRRFEGACAMQSRKPL